MNSLWPLVVIGILHQNEGIDAQKNDVSCSSCGCSPGFVGTDCSVPIMNIIGSITYQIAANDRGNFNETLFTARLFFLFPLHVNVTVSVFNHSQSSAVSFVVSTALPKHFTSNNVTKYQSDLSVRLMDGDTTAAAFPNSTSVVASSAKADVDECSSSSLHSCGTSQVCFSKDDGFGCSCRTGYTEVNGSCTEIFCMLRDAPRLPGLATRSIRYLDGSYVPSSNNGRLPYKTHIVYTCPNRYTLVDSASGSAQVDVIECVGSTATTRGNTGWSGGGEVRCAMTIQYQIAIITAAISSAIIVLMIGAFIVSCSNKKKKDESDRVGLGVNAVGMEHSV